MSNGEVKLSLFISNQKGCGKKLLQEMMDKFRHRDLRHLYLWTDTSCTHEYYPQHGFTLVSQFLSEVYDSYAPGYTTYIYKKGISSESK
jgi:Acetyltransferase (GNAT) family.